MIFLMVGFLLITAAVAVAWFSDADDSTKSAVSKQYHYGRKSAVMTPRELKFFRRLERVVQGRYYIFPQMHLSAMMFNRTSGRYRQLAFQRINRTSVDFVLCDKDTLSPVYAIELDDKTHDTEKRRQRDAGVEAMLKGVEIALVRFRDVESMSDEQLIEAFQDAAARQPVKV